MSSDNKDPLLERIAQLEFQVDQLTAELEYVDQLLRSVGFTEGLTSVKAAAQELSEQDHKPEEDDPRFETGLPDEPPGLY
jgi:hypothetical protein